MVARPSAIDSISQELPMLGNHHSTCAVWMRLMLVLALVSVPANSQSSAGTFDKINAEVRQTNTGTSSSSPSETASPPSRKQEGKESRNSRDHHDEYCEDDDDNDNAFAAFLATGVLVGVTSPFWGPNVALEDDMLQAGYFPEHPYENAEGSLLYDKSSRGAHDSLIVLQGQYGDDYDDIFHANGRVLMEHSSRFGFDTEFFYRNEDVQTGHDELWTGDFNITYRFAQSMKWQFRAGLGANWLVYDDEADEGINFTYGADWFPADPIVVSALLDWGRIGDAGLFHGRTTIGLSHNGWGVFTGYDFFEIGHQEIHSWINGIELRF